MSLLGLGRVRLVAWKRRSSRFCALLKSDPMYFSNMVRVASASRASSSAICVTRTAVRRVLEIGNVLHRHDCSLGEQSAETGGMVSSGTRRIDAKPAHVFEAIE
jgi:hypothetical protein